jgi:GNAT superfamily N-acetyltransferase
VIRLVQAHPDDPAARPLLDGLAEEYARLYGGGPTDDELRSRGAEDFVPPRGVLLLLVEDGETIAGGALAPLQQGVAEVKRMWTGPAHRRQGYARHVLAALELEAVVLGYRAIRLQTGKLSAPALALYAEAGYHASSPFGRYERHPLLVGFEKQLA